MSSMRPGSVALLLMLSACTVGPDYHAPKLALPDRLGDMAAPVPDMRGWWRQFQDPVLDRLIEQALADNLDLRRAAVRVREARAQRAVAYSASGPKLNAGAQAGYSRLSQNALPDALARLGSAGSGGQGGSGAIGLPGEDFASFQTGFDAAWELDLFGGQRRADQAADARLSAAGWNARDVQVTIAAEVAATYQDYRLLQRRLALTDQQIAARSEAQSLARVRADHGLTTAIDPRNADAAIAQLIAARAGMAAELDAGRHALATLLGLNPDALTDELADGAGESPRIVDVPAGLPSELLERRPDLRAAERQLAAATADIGVAQAELYPKFSLTGALNLASRGLSNMLSSNSIAANGAGRLSLPLIGRGGARATVALRRAQADEVLLTYQAQVLGALREVADGLTRLSAARARIAALNAAEAAAADNARTAEVQYRHGLIARARLIDAQLTLLNTQDTRLQAEGEAARDMIALYKALGGGWDDARVTDEGGDGHGDAG